MLQWFRRVAAAISPGGLAALSFGVSSVALTLFNKVRDALKENRESIAALEWLGIQRFSSSPSR